MKRQSKVPILNYLKKQKQAFKKQAQKTYLNSTSANVHELRVIVRRLRAVLWLMEHGEPHLSFGKLTSSLRKLGQALGERRELDVALQDAKRYHLSMTKLRSQRQTAKKLPLAQIDPNHQKKILHQIDRTTVKLKKYPEFDLTSGLLRLRARLKPWASRTTIGDDELHELRIAAKKARYALEAISRPTQPLRNLQSLLGRGHDLEVLQDRLGKNSKVQSDVAKQYRKAKQVIRPALQFALRQLETR